MSACTGAKSSANTASFVATTARSATPPLPVRLSASAPFGLPNLTPHALATASASLVRRELDLSKFRSGPVESKIRYQWSDHGSDDTAAILNNEFKWDSIRNARTSGITSRMGSPIEVPLAVMAARAASVKPYLAADSAITFSRITIRFSNSCRF